REYLGQGEEPLCLRIGFVGRSDDIQRSPCECFAVLEGAAASKDPRPYGPPEELGRNIIGRRDLLALDRVPLRLVQPPLPIQRFSKEGGGRGDVVVLSHLVERVVIAPELLDGTIEVASKHLDGPGVDRGERCLELPPELYEDRAAL